MQTILQVLMERDDLTEVEAQERINDCKEMIAEGEDPEEVLMDELGLEPDYIFDLL